MLYSSHLTGLPSSTDAVVTKCGDSSEAARAAAVKTGERSHRLSRRRAIGSEGIACGSHHGAFAGMSRMPALMCLWLFVYCVCLVLLVSVMGKREWASCRPQELHLRRKMLCLKQSISAPADTQSNKKKKKKAHAVCGLTRQGECA